MALFTADMRAIRTRTWTWLSTFETFRLALANVTSFVAIMAARQFQITRSTATDILLETWDRTTDRFSTVASFFHQDRARRTLGFWMAVMKDIMATRVYSCARFGAFGRGCSTIHRGIYDSCTTVTSKFVKRDIWTASTAPTVTLRLTLTTTFEFFVANFRTNVITVAGIQSIWKSG